MPISHETCVQCQQSNLWSTRAKKSAFASALQGLLIVAFDLLRVCWINKGSLMLCNDSALRHGGGKSFQVVEMRYRIWKPHAKGLLIEKQQVNLKYNFTSKQLSVLCTRTQHQCRPFIMMTKHDSLSHPDIFQGRHPSQRGCLPYTQADTMGRRQLIKRAGSLLKQAGAAETSCTSSSATQSAVPIFSLRRSDAGFTRYLSTLARESSAAGAPIDGNLLPVRISATERKESSLIQMFNRRNSSS